MMPSEFLVFFVVSALPCVLAQISLSLSAPTLVKPSQTMKLACKVTGAPITDGKKIHAVNFVRQEAGDKLVFLAHLNYNQDTAYNPSFSSRISLSRDTSKNEVYLAVSALVVEDTATYFCASQPTDGSGYFDVWGNGQSVIVSSAEQQAPSLFPLYSCGTSQDSLVTIGCLARDFLPQSINFSWTDKSNNSFTSGLKTYQPVLEKSGTFFASSQVKVTSESWEKNEPYYCKATHTLNSKVRRLENKKVTKVMRPVVTMHAPVKEDLNTNDNGTIVCHISGFYPNDITVKWLKNSVETTLNTMTEKAEPDANGSFSVSSYITVSKKTWDEDSVFSCVVKHPPSSFDETRNLSKSQACETPVAVGVIQVTVVPPSFETIYFDKKAKLTCIISNMATPDGLEVSWYELYPEKLINTTIHNYVYQDSAFLIKATAEVCADEWPEKTFECRVKHPDLTSPKKEILVKENGQENQAPTVLLFPPHQDELNKKESLTVTCVVKRFYPKNAFVRWMINDQMQTGDILTTEPMEESSKKKSYIMYSTLTLPSIVDWTSGKSITCLVGHEALPLQTTQKTIDKTTGKPTSVNVSLVMSDSC